MSSSFLIIAAALAQVTGVVLDPSGKPVLTLPNVPEGECRVTSGTTINLDVPMKKILTVAGVVLDGDVPVPGATVIFDQARTTTDEKSRFAVTGDAADLVLRFDRGSTVRGSVIRKGVPVAHAKVYTRAVDPPNSSQWRETDDRGNFELRGIISGPHNVDVVITDRWRRLGVVPIKAGAPLVLELEGEPASLSGSIRGLAADERAVTEVVVVSVAGASASVQADDSYRVNEIAPGDVRVNVIVKMGSWVRNYVIPPLTLAPAESRTLDVDCSAALEISGRVTVDNNPVPGTQIHFVAKDDALYASATSDSRGEYQVRLHKGAYRVMVYARDRLIRSFEREITSSGRIDLECR